MIYLKNIFLLLFVTLFFSASQKAFSQSTYTTTSKSCGSCRGSVSSNSTIGMYCPHCGVRWGYENKTYSKTERNSYNYNYSYPSTRNRSNHRYIESYSRGQRVYAKSTINVRSGPGTNYSIINSISSFEGLTIIERSGDWYYVSYSHFNNYNYQLETKYGYVAGWLVKSYF